MRHYCSLADSKYLPQLLVLYESLKKHSSEPFTLYVLPMDDEAFNTLAAMVLPNVQVVAGFHGSVTMLKARAERTHQEYCWTCASNFCEVLLGWANWHDDADGMESITYLDADMMFFSDPEVIHDEIGDRSIAVIPHRLIPSKKHLEVNGKFNVSWVTFKNNPIGRECLSSWAAQCREKCSATDGCGDQLYLNSWPDKYGDELCVIQNIGAGLAPWNLANYELFTMFADCPPQLLPSGGEKTTSTVFYHYHEYIHGERLTNYELRPEDIELIYKPYIQAVTAAKERINNLQLQT